MSFTHDHENPFPCRDGLSEAEARETAALYALGALGPDEMLIFEGHLESGCELCAMALREDSETAARLAAAAGSVVPPASLRERLLSAIASPPADDLQVWKAWSPGSSGRDRSELEIVRGGDDRWKTLSQPGVSVKPLHVDPERRAVTMLVRMAAGASWPAHRHGDGEECFVLEGDLRVGEAVMHAGDYQFSPAGSKHGIQSTEKGCLLLIVSSQDDELI